MSKKHTFAANPNPPTVYRLLVKGHLDPRWTDGFEDMSITHEANGVTHLTGPVADQAALHGLLRRMRDLGMTLLCVVRVPSPGTDAADVSS